MQGTSCPKVEKTLLIELIQLHLAEDCVILENVVSIDLNGCVSKVARTADLIPDKLCIEMFAVS